MEQLLEVYQAAYDRYVETAGTLSSAATAETAETAE